MEHFIYKLSGCPNSYTNDVTNSWTSPISFPGESGYSNTVYQPTKLEYVLQPTYSGECSPPTGSWSLELFDEYTDGELWTNIMGLMPLYPDDWYTPEPVYYSFWATIAYSVINGNHVNAECWWPPYKAELQKMKYRFVVPESETSKQYLITWDLITWRTSDGHVTRHPNSITLSGTGGTLEHEPGEVLPPDWDNSLLTCGGVVLTWVENVNVTVSESAPEGSVPGVGPYPSSSLAGGHGCGSCSSGADTFGQAQSWVGFAAEFSMGRTAKGFSAGNLRVSSALPNLSLATPAGLSYAVNNPDIQVVLLSDQIRQVKAPQALADVIATNAFHYDIRFYAASQVGAQTNASGIFTNITGSPFVTWRIENPDASTNTYNRVRVTETRGADVKVYDSIYTNGTWNLGYPGGLREDVWTVTTVTNGTTVYPGYIFSAPGYDRTVTGIIRAPGGPDQFKVKRVYRSTDWGEALVEETLSPDNNPQTTIYIYDPYTPGPDARPRLQKIIRPDGSSQTFTYDGYGRYSIVYSSLGNIPPDDTYNARRTEYYYGPSESDDYYGAWSSGDHGTLQTNTPRCVVEAHGTAWSVSRRITAIPSADVRIEIQVADTYGGYWYDSNNLFTTNRYYTSGPNTNRLKSVVHPDKTLATYDYAVDAVTGYQTNMSASGQANATFTAVVAGTTNWAVLNPFGYPVLAVSKDITSGIVLSQSTYTNFDSFGRPARVTYVDGTYEETQYACCGLDATVDRDGAVTQYWYDAAKRPTAQLRLNITTTNVLDAVGRVLKTIRKGSDGSQITLRQASYDLAGGLLTETNALSGVTTYLEMTNSAAGGLIKVVIAPDGGTTTNYYYMDGSLQKTIGTAVHGARYEQGIEENWFGDGSDYLRPYTMEIKLKNDGSDSSEWTRSYTDFAGRTYKTMYADATPEDLSDNPYSRFFYNSKGQLWKQRDPDGVVTLYQYNAKGEIEYTAVDLDQDDTIDFSGLDRINRTTNDVIANYGTNVRRTQSYVYPTDSSSTTLLVSKSESSTDGLRSWQTIYRDASTPVTNRSRTVYAGSGNRYGTNTAPDGSYAVSAFSYGRLASTTRYSASGSQITRSTYAYDTHGRQSTITDARNGATTFTYNSADLMASVTTPNPGTIGGAPQTTLTYYNPMQQTTNVVNPDGTSVTTEYYLTGELKRNYGSRTYPVAYSYDYAGRMKTMTNWTAFPSTGARVTTWNYDAYRGWLTNKTYDGGAAGPIYSNTAAGRLATRKWARMVGGQPLVTTYGYGNAGELARIVYSDGTTPNVTNTFDRLGRAATTICAGMTTTFSYNDASELLSETFSGGTLNGLAVTNAYDVYLRRTAVGLNTQTATLTQFGYDNASRLAGVTNGYYSAGYGYLANSPLVSTVTFRTNTTTRMTTTKTYDILNRLTSIRSINSQPSTINSHEYQYNQANQRTRATLSDGSYWLYEYDSLGQVRSGKKYWYDGTPVVGQQFEYAFDDIGNRAQTKAGGDENGWNLRSANYAANNLNQLTSRDVPGFVDIMGISFATNSVTVNGQTAYRKGEYFRKELPVNNASAPLWTNIIVAATGQTSVTGNVFVAKTAETFGYDPDGNMTNDGRWSLTWDGENRLTKAESKSDAPSLSKRKVVWEFDWRGRRIRQTTSDGSSGSYVVMEDLKFLSDGWRHIAELNATNNALARSYIWGLDLSESMDGAGGVGGLLMLNSVANGVHFYSYDGNGNVAALAKGSDGTGSANYEYDPFGSVVRSTGMVANENRFQFSTKRADRTTDFKLYEYRVLSFCWLSRDPAHEKGGKNLYGFVKNNPLGSVDVLGLWTARVHRDMTITWAYEASFNITYAGIIGEEDIGVDDIWRGRSWLPRPFGQQERHLNHPSFRGGGDSRDFWYNFEFTVARVLLAAGGTEQNPIRCFEAAQAFGRGLHSRQDSSAHRNWPEQGRDWSDWIAHPGWWDAWIDDELTHQYPSDLFWRRWFEARGDVIYDSWEGLDTQNGQLQYQSQIAARQRVTNDSRRAIDDFVSEVRRHCFCRNQMLRNP